MTCPVRRHHHERDIMRAISLFFAVRGVVRTRLAQGKKLDPSAWLRIETMKFIANEEEPSMKDVADYLSITPPSATSLVRSLIDGGFVESRPDERDRRTLRLSLTKEGKTELRAATQHARRVLGDLFESLSARELSAFTRALEHIRDAA